jgi:murein DD-endopeptidase MepM/ murein hydrolase activator NlpD
MKFRTKEKGFIAQKFGGNPDIYASRGVSGHTGVDYVKGYGALHQVDNEGYVYKVYKPLERADRWVGVYMLVPYGKDFMEVVMGHFSKVLVDEGDTVYEGSYVGYEGNSGFVISGGMEITPAMQDAGNKQGAHVHESYRPVRKVKTKTKGKFYLSGHNGDYKDKDGYLYEIINTDAIKGYIDPMQFQITETVMEKLARLMGTLLRLKKSI